LLKNIRICILCWVCLIMNKCPWGLSYI
jgi:hypothetical protein